MKTETQAHTIHYGERDISFSLQRNGRQRLKIVVTPELAVQVLAPKTATDDQVLSAVHKKAFWTTQKLDKLASFLQAKADWKKQMDDVWREIREAKLLVEHVKIEEVLLKKIEDVTPEQYRVIAVAVPVFRHKGELAAVPMMAMYFVQVSGQWKYTSEQVSLERLPEKLSQLFRAVNDAITDAGRRYLAGRFTKNCWTECLLLDFPSILRFISANPTVCYYDILDI